MTHSGFILDILISINIVVVLNTITYLSDFVVYYLSYGIFKEFLRSVKYNAKRNLAGNVVKRRDVYF